MSFVLKLLSGGANPSCCLILATSIKITFRDITEIYSTRLQINSYRLSLLTKIFQLGTGTCGPGGPIFFRANFCQYNNKLTT